jgi:hypothetical protein
VVDLDADEIVARWPLVAAGASIAWTGDRGLCVLGPVEAGGQAGFGVFVVGLDEKALRLVTGELDADPIALAGDAPFLAVADGLDSYLARLDGDALLPLGHHVGTANRLGASRDGGVVACCLSHHIPDVWAGPPDGELLRVSDLAPELADVQWGPQERLAWRAPDGLELDGLLILPRALRRQPPALGGVPRPVARDGRLRRFCPNPRGGFGHGAEFAQAVRGAVGVSVTGPTSNPGSIDSSTRAWPTRSGSRSEAGAKAAT